MLKLFKTWVKDRDRVNWKTYAVYLLCAAVINPIWGWFTPAFLLPGAVDSPLSRAIGTSIAYVGLLAAFFVKIRKYLGFFVAANSYLLLGHYFWLCHVNNYHPVYANGVYIPLVAVAVFFDDLVLLTIYSLLIYLYSFLILSHPQPLSTPLFFIVGVGTVNLVVSVTTALKIRIDQKYKKLLEEQAMMREKQAALKFEQERQRKLAKLVAGIAHEINSPLAIIVGTQNQMIRFPDRVKELSQKFLTHNIRAAERISNIVSDIHTIVIGAYTKSLESVDIYQMIQPSIERLRSDIEKEGLTIRQDKESLSFSVKVNRESTPRAFFEVFKNAVHFCQNSPEKEIKIWFDSGLRALMVSNTGVLIDKQKSELIFEPFYTERILGQGIGLGLSMARAAMENIGGRVEHQSEAKETTFSLYFPKDV